MEKSQAQGPDGASPRPFAPDMPASAEPERRFEERRATLLRIGKLIVAGEQRLCMIRNISSAGTMFTFYQPIAAGERIEIEVTPDCPVQATVMWVRDDLAGAAFVEPIDVEAALRGGKQDGPYRRIARTPRLKVSCPARLRVEDVEHAVTLCDLSLNGARIATDAAPEEDSEVTLLIEGLPPCRGNIRWRRDGHAGIQFDVRIQMPALAAWFGSPSGQACAG